MNITSKASITVSATLSAAEVLTAISAVPGATEAVLDMVQGQAVKDATGLTFVSRNAAAGDNGSVGVELVYEKTVADAAPTPVVDASTSAGSAAPAPAAPIVFATPSA